MICRKVLLGVVVLMVGACARQPALCARPPDQIPVAPRAQQERRLVAALGQDRGCHIKVHLRDVGPDSSWQAERAAAVTAAQLAARACCARPQVHNLAGWPVGQTHFDLEFECSQP